MPASWSYSPAWVFALPKSAFSLRRKSIQRIYLRLPSCLVFAAGSISTC
jgi:hypothetical protein